MTDLVNRQDVLDLAKDIVVPTKDGETYRHRCIDPDKVKRLPHISYGWIPISSGEFPASNEDVLLASKNNYVVGYRSVKKDGSWEWLIDVGIGDLLAWMPIPKYEGE